MLYERLVRRIIRGQRLASEVLSPEMENVLHRNTNNVNCMKSTAVSFRYCARFCEVICTEDTPAYLG